MAKRRKWAPKREPDELDDLLFPEPTADDLNNPFVKLAHENPSVGDRPWLYPECETEPSLARWIAALVAIDDPRRKDQAPLAVVLKSDHPLQQHARRHLIDFIDRHQERNTLAPLLDKLQSSAELSGDDRLALADLLEQQPWKKTPGNRPASHERRDENAALDYAETAVLDLKTQGKQLDRDLQDWMTGIDRENCPLKNKSLSFEQAFDKAKNRSWSVKDVTLKERVTELESQGLKPQQIKDQLVSELWVRVKDDKTIEQALLTEEGHKRPLLKRMSLDKALDELARQRGWISQQTAPDITVKQAVDELITSEGLSLRKAVDRLTSQRWTTNEAVNRVSKWQDIPEKTLRNYCNKGRPSLRPKK